MANDLIKKARAKKNKYYDENIELALENVEQRIMADAENGKSKTYIGFNSRPTSPDSKELTVETIAKKYTDKFIESIQSHFKLTKHQILKVPNNKSVPTSIVGIEILWGEEYE